jgi:hypothetical protein
MPYTLSVRVALGNCCCARSRSTLGKQGIDETREAQKA